MEGPGFFLLYAMVTDLPYGVQVIYGIPERQAEKCFPFSVPPANSKNF